MVTLYDVDGSELIRKVAEDLKKIKEIKPPEWAKFVKTGVHKERPPADKDWWYIRAASILKAVDKQGAIGVSKLRTKYGGKKNRGAAPERFRKASGSIIRKILQQLEKAGLVKKDLKALHKGRLITNEGISLLNNSAKSLRTASKKQEIKKRAEPKKEENKPEKKSKEESKEVPKENPKEGKKPETKEISKDKKQETKEEKKSETKETKTSEKPGVKEKQAEPKKEENKPEKKSEEDKPKNG